MSKNVSLVVLLVIMLFIAVLFFQVMADFLLPLFMALLFVIIFGPMHRWIREHVTPRTYLAAGFSTLVIFLLFLIPSITVLVQAGREAKYLYRIVAADVDRSRSHFERPLPAADTAPDAAELMERNPGAFKEWLSVRIVAVAKHFDFDLKPEEVKKGIETKVDEWLTPLAVGTGQFLGRTLLGLIIMIVAVFFFFADGRAMVLAILRLLPLDEKYEEQLVERFDNVTRAVVLSQILAALAQGLLAGIGFYFVGAKPVFLLMVITSLLALIPFIGAAGVWISVSLWLALLDERIGAAVGMALYGLCIVSTVDNIIKPWVLHGQSKMHPLLALLSVLGGVKALGPIGIFVGPMAVAFLQTLLQMVNAELLALEKREKTV